MNDAPHLVSESKWIPFALVPGCGAQKRSCDRVFKFMVYFFPLAVATVSLLEAALGREIRTLA